MKTYGEIFNKSFVPLYIFANKYIQNIDTSKDIVQEVFVNILEKKISIDDKKNINGFLYKLVRNKSLDFLKSKHIKYFDNYDLKDLELLQPLIEDTEKNNFDISRIVHKNVDLLSNRCKQTIKLSIDGYKLSEIAEEMDISIRTVEQHKRIAYIHLRMSKELINLKNNY